ncbi:hypothetical protein BN946_scf185031.g3 [Trametes cinnabarina]|uniref:Uncharacterized protein n=1 Tax=Pycnoporus cinnabarinus TaxID=5643 RepID=A0A060SP68_PYCCI|nr:hypothetical protein BN946_scf185031.g3 [Trametes cinnabarina]
MPIRGRHRAAHRIRRRTRSSWNAQEKQKRMRPDDPYEQHDPGRHRRHATPSKGCATTRTREDEQKFQRKRGIPKVRPPRDVDDDDNGEPAANTGLPRETLRTRHFRSHKRDRAQRARTSAVPPTACAAAAEHSSPSAGPSPLPAQDHAIRSSLLAGAERRPYRLYTKDDRGTPVPDMITMFWREQGPEAIRQQFITTDRVPPHPSQHGASAQSTLDGNGPAGTLAAQADPVTHTPTKPSAPVSELPPTGDIKVTSPAPPSVPPRESLSSPPRSTSRFADSLDLSATSERPDPVETQPESARVVASPSSVIPDSVPPPCTPPVVHVQPPSNSNAENVCLRYAASPRAEPADAIRPGRGARDHPIVVEDCEPDVRETTASSSSSKMKDAIIDLTLESNAR